MSSPGQKQGGCGHAVVNDKPTTSKAKTVKTESNSATDSKIAQFDQKWSDKFNHLEALVMTRTLEPTFLSDVKVISTHSPPAGAIKDTEPFVKPTQPANISSEFCGTDSCAVKHQSTSKTDTSTRIFRAHWYGLLCGKASVHQQAHTDRPKYPDPTGTDSPVLHWSTKDSISSLSSQPDSEVSDYHWICMWKKASCQKIKTLLLINSASPSLRNNHTERQ